MSTEIQQTENGLSEVPQEVISKLVLYGDLSGMQPAEKTAYYNGICKSLGLNPLTQPFAITKLNGKEVMYATKNCAEQLRRIYDVSVTDLKTEVKGDIYIVTATGKNREGRIDSAMGAISLTGKNGEALANSLMKCETKAKRRLTLSLCGLGMLDETEVDSVKTEEVQSNTQYTNIDVVSPTPEVLNKYEPMLAFVMDTRIPDHFFEGQTRQQFVEDFKNELLSGTMPVSKAENIYNTLLSFAK